MGVSPIHSSLAVKSCSIREPLNTRPVGVAKPALSTGRELLISVIKPFLVKQLCKLKNLLPIHIKGKNKGKSNLFFVANADILFQVLLRLFGAIEIRKVIFNAVCFKFISGKLFKGKRQCRISFQLRRYGNFIKGKLNIAQARYPNHRDGIGFPAPISGFILVIMPVIPAGFQSKAPMGQGADKRRLFQLKGIINLIQCLPVHPIFLPASKIPGNCTTNGRTIPPSAQKKTPWLKNHGVKILCS